MTISTPLVVLINLPMKVGSSPYDLLHSALPLHITIYIATNEPFSVYNHVLRLDLNTLRWELVDNYGDIPGVRMGKPSLFLPSSDSQRSM